MGYLQTFQNNFPHIKYSSPSNPGGTVASSGCGPCSLLQVLENMTPIRVKMQPWIDWVISTGARVSGGTAMGTLLKAFCKKYAGFSYTTTSNETTLAAHLRAGGMAIGNVGGAYGSWRGLFSTGGHYITIFGVTPDGYFIVGDPDWRAGKFDGSSSLAKWRAARCKQIEKLIYVTAANLNSDTATRSPNYYLVSYKPKEEEDIVTQAEFNAMMAAWNKANNPTYNTVEDVPEYWRQEVARLIRIGAIKGDGINPVAKTHSELAAIMVAVSACEKNNPVYASYEDIPEWLKDETKELMDAGALRGNGDDHLDISEAALKGAIIGKRYCDGKEG